MDDDTKEALKMFLRFLIPIILVGAAFAVFSVKILLALF